MRRKQQVVLLRMQLYLTKKIDETLRICRDKDILTAYLEREEVATIMYKYMDQETAMKKALRAERQEGRQETERRSMMADFIPTPR